MKNKLLSLTLSALIFSHSLIAYNAVSAETSEAQTKTAESTRQPLTHETAKQIFAGQIRQKNGNTDSLLYKGGVGKLLDPNADDDEDGRLNKDELYTYEENGVTYYGYNSHPFLYDTDGDGLNDKDDANPLVWDISARDMAMFMELVYRDETYIRQVLDETKPLPYLYKKDGEQEGRKEYQMMHTELANFWEVKKVYFLENGFQAVLFANKSSYPYLQDDKVQVLAIRGTQEAKDYDDDAALTTGNNPGQIYVLERVLQEIDRDKLATNLYATGHSLGGYLAKRGLIYATKKNFSWFKKAYTFNAPRIYGWIFNLWLNDEAKIGDKLTEEGKAVHYKTDNDSLINKIGSFAGSISIGSSKNGHSSRTFFEESISNRSDFIVGRRNSMHGEGYADEKLKEIRPVVVNDKDVFELKFADEDILEGERPDFSDNLLNPQDMPANAKITDATDYKAVKLDEEGSYPGKIKVIFNDDSFKEYDVKINVNKKSLELISIPEIKAENISSLSVFQGEKLDVKAGIVGLSDVKEILVLGKKDGEDIWEPSSEKIGSYKASLKIVFQNGSSRVVLVPVEIKAKEVSEEANPVVPAPEAPAEPAPAEPSPVPAEPTPAEPAQPTPEPAKPIVPKPEVPAEPIKPEPTKPAPVPAKPAPTNPAPAKPKPTPTPVVPTLEAPAKPAPVLAKPIVPKPKTTTEPIKPEPTKPAPVQANPAPTEPNPRPAPVVPTLEAPAKSAPVPAKPAVPKPETTAEPTKPEATVEPIKPESTKPAPVPAEPTQLTPVPAKPVLPKLEAPAETIKPEPTKPAHAEPEPTKPAHTKPKPTPAPVVPTLETPAKPAPAKPAPEPAKPVVPKQEATAEPIKPENKAEKAQPEQEKPRNILPIIILALILLASSLIFIVRKKRANKK